MRTLAIGDIHGCLTALDTLLAVVRPEPDDLVITLGDYVDRGPDSRRVLNRLLHLASVCQLIALRGNHDQMMLEARGGAEPMRDWLGCGGRETLRSYAPDGKAGSLDHVSVEHWQFLEETCRPWFETDTHLFAHANLYPDLPLVEQPDSMLYWEKLAPHWSHPHCSGKTLICGHTAQRTGVPLDLGHAVCIDTFVYGTGWLTCLDVVSGKYWQANQAGEPRIGRLA